MKRKGGINVIVGEHRAPKERGHGRNLEKNWKAVVGQNKSSGAIIFGFGRRIGIEDATVRSRWWRQFKVIGSCTRIL